MENREQDRALQASAEDKDLNTDKNNEESIEGRRKKHHADSGNDDSFNEMLQKEIRIDPGNEHHHRTDADDKIFDDDIDRSPRFEADSGGDATIKN